MNTSKLSIQIYYFIYFFDFILLEMLAWNPILRFILCIYLKI